MVYPKPLNNFDNRAEDLSAPPFPKEVTTIHIFLPLDFNNYYLCLKYNLNEDIIGW